MRILIFCLGLMMVPQLFAKDRKKKKTISGVQTTYSTSLDFDSTMIDGKMKAPSGFFLQGRNKQSLQSMVRLRSNFRDELNRSQHSIKASIK